METPVSELLENNIWLALNQVKDPEIPVLSIVEMGMIAGVKIHEHKTEVIITPTFVGCPALHVIQQNVKDELHKQGIDAEVKIDLSIKWTTERMTAEAREKLEKFGLAPPPHISDDELTEEQLNRVRCPFCHSTDTTLRSAFGSTLCRAIRFCFNCKQGFEQFKPVT
ncbi:MAG: phenylacetate-CoA oxygenase subunit PaaJ [Chitinophagales bacterium]|nr:phenylacetate-CoA oxygenase subunit PaaJ [Chitinophagales bacterium]